MRVLLDTNIILDNLLGREPFVRDAKALLQTIESGQIQGYITATTLTDIFYIAKKSKGTQIAKQDISELLAVMQICTVDRSILEAAILSNLSDFEDAVQLACAIYENLDAIVTRDAVGFAGANIPITASSEFGVDGTVELNTLEIDPSSSLINLPTIPINTEVAQGCDSPNYAQNSFVITGRGGLPADPQDILTPDAVLVDLISLNPSQENSSNRTVTSTTTTPKQIVEATGWVVNEKGEVILTADSPTATPRSPWQTLAHCSIQHK